MRTLEVLSEPARKQTGEPWIGRVYRPGVDPAGYGGPEAMLSTDLGARLTLFAEMLEICGSEGEGCWSFAPSQLRRAFAVYYYHGNRFSTLDALSRFLRHFDPEVTRLYIADALPGALLRLHDVMEARVLLAEEKKDREIKALQAHARDAFDALTGSPKISSRSGGKRSSAAIWRSTMASRSRSGSALRRFMPIWRTSPHRPGQRSGSPPAGMDLRRRCGARSSASSERSRPIDSWSPIPESTRTAVATQAGPEIWKRRPA